MSVPIRHVSDKLHDTVPDGGWRKYSKFHKTNIGFFNIDESSLHKIYLIRHHFKFNAIFKMDSEY